MVQGIDTVEEVEQARSIIVDATNQKLLNDEIGANHIKEATRINNNTNTDNSDGNYGNAHDNKRSPSISRNYHFSN